MKRALARAAGTGLALLRRQFASGLSELSRGPVMPLVPLLACPRQPALVRLRRQMADVRTVAKLHQAA